MRKRDCLIMCLAVLLIAALLFICLLAWLLFREREEVSYDINKWNELQEEFTYLPSINEIGQCKDIRFKYLHKDSFIFQSDTYTIKVTYSKEDFDVQKRRIENTYSLQETVINYGEITTEKETAFKLDDFEFQMLALHDYNLDYPKQMVFVGVSEKNNEIAFVFFDDVDLDYLECSFEDFLINECGWE